MSAPQQISLAQLIDSQITKLICMKGQIDGIVGSMPADSPYRSSFSWIQGLLYEMLGMSNAIKADYTSTTVRLLDVEKTVRAILGADWDTPPQEVMERAQALGMFYKELMKKGKGET